MCIQTEDLRANHTIFLSCLDVKDLIRLGCLYSIGREINIDYIVVERVRGSASSPMQWDSNVVGGLLYSVRDLSVWRKWWSWSALQKSKANLPSGCIRVWVDGHLSKLRKCDAWKQSVSSKWWNGPPQRPRGKMGLPNSGYNGKLVVVITGFLHRALQTSRVEPTTGWALSIKGKTLKHQGALQRGMVQNCSSWVHNFWAPCRHQSITRVRWTA